MMQDDFPAGFEKQLKDSGCALIWDQKLKQWELREPWRIERESDVVMTGETLIDLLGRYTESGKSALDKAIDALLNFKPLATPREFDEDETDDSASFFSERFLYAVLGKEDARTVRALLSKVLKTAGVTVRKW